MEANKFFSSLLIIFIYSLLVSCIRPLDIQVSRDVKPSVNCIISNYDTTVKMALYWGKIPGDTSKFVPIDNSNVWLYEEDNEIGLFNFTTVEPLTGPMEEIYILNHKPEVGKTYSFRASIPQYGDIMGHTIIPVPAQLEYKGFDTIYLPDEQGDISRYITFYLTVYDPALSQTNHYAFGLKCLGFDLKEIKGPNLFFKYDDRDPGRLIIFSDEYAEDGKINLEVTGENSLWFEDPFDYQSIVYDTLAVKFFIYTLSDDAYWIFLQHNFSRLNDFGILPLEFMEEPVTTYSNIENGYGYFAGLAVDSIQIRLSFK